MIFRGAIDAHAHLWEPSRNDDILVLKKRPELGPTADPGSLGAHLDATGFAGAIVVQSAPSKDHSDWLRQSARKEPRVTGIVGWLDLFAADADIALRDLTADPLVCGIRIMLNRMDRPERLLNAESLALLDKLTQAGMAIECLAPRGRLGIVAQLAEQLGQSRFIIDHCGFPDAFTDLTEWSTDMARLARLTNISVKFSGLTEPFGTGVSLEQILDRAQRTLGMFGPDRLMAASNFPVCDLGGGAERWGELLAEIIDKSGLSPDDRANLLRHTACKVYSRMNT